MGNYNNFHGYFPNGFYRKNNIRPHISRALDLVLSEINFDIARFHEGMERHSRIFKETRDFYIKLQREKRELTPKEQKRDQELERENKKLNATLERLLEPVYKRMRELGFSHEDLVR